MGKRFPQPGQKRGPVHPYRNTHRPIQVDGEGIGTTADGAVITQAGPTDCCCSGGNPPCEHTDCEVYFDAAAIGFNTDFGRCDESQINSPSDCGDFSDLRPDFEELCCRFTCSAPSGPFTFTSPAGSFQVFDWCHYAEVEVGAQWNPFFDSGDVSKRLSYSVWGTIEVSATEWLGFYILQQTQRRRSCYADGVGPLPGPCELFAKGDSNCGSSDNWGFVKTSFWRWIGPTPYGKFNSRQLCCHTGQGPDNVLDEFYEDSVTVAPSFLLPPYDVNSAFRSSAWAVQRGAVLQNTWSGLGDFSFGTDVSFDRWGCA